MSYREFTVPDIGLLKVYKRHGTRNLRLSLQHDGGLRVTIPTWLPYGAGVEFALSRQEWIRNHAQPPLAPLTNGQLVGKSHRLRFIDTIGITKPATRVRQTEIVVQQPAGSATTDPIVQKAARQAAIRALRLQAERLLPIRLSELARQHGFRYKSVGVKLLKSRWGSCDQDTNLTLNLFLMLLPWELIDYVLLHELTHTQVMQHGPEFWQAMIAVEPRTPELRKAIRRHKPTL